MTTVVSLGGSIVAPEGPDAAFLASFKELVDRHLAVDPGRRLILVVGGGGPARLWQKAFREVAATAGVSLETKAALDAQDWVGIMATRLNAQLVKAICGELAPQDVIIDPSAVELFMGRVLVAAGWKPGWSTDYDAVLLAERFGADTVINLSNVAKVYTDDPRANPAATPIDTITWTDFRAMVGERWTPGRNVPFDPIASKRAAELGLRVVCAAGRDLPNLEAILEGREFTGTVIGAR